MKYGFYISHVNTNTIFLTSISNKKDLKQAPQTDKHKGSSQTKKLTIYAATILRLSSTQQ